METDKFNTRGIYGIYCKDSDVYSKTIAFTSGLIGSILAEDNSSVVLYNSDISSDANYMEAHQNSSIYNGNAEYDKNKPIYKAQNNSFINFPMPIYDANSTNILENSTGFNTNNITISNLSGKATSILYNNGFEFYLSKLKNGMLLSDITINTTSYTQLKKYLECLPRNLNGFNLNIILNNTEKIPLTFTNQKNEQQRNDLIINNFYGGIITLQLKSKDDENGYRVTAAINYCENVIIKDSTNIQYDINFTTDIHLNKGTKFNNVLFSVDSANIFGENIEFTYTNTLTQDILNWNTKFNNEYYWGNYGKIITPVSGKEFYLNIFALRAGSKCFIDSYSTFVNKIEKAVITKFTVDNNSQATWLSSEATNLKEFEDENNQTISWIKRSRYPNVVDELNHQHIYAERDSTDDDALENTYIGYPIVWQGTTPVFDDNAKKRLMLPIPPHWQFVGNTLLSDVRTNYQTESGRGDTFGNTCLSALLGDQVNFYISQNISSHDHDHSVNITYAIYSATDYYLKVHRTISVNTTNFYDFFYRTDT